jgi:peptide/nickel transport system substrate-binding protein
MKKRSMHAVLALLVAGLATTWAAAQPLAFVLDTESFRATEAQAIVDQLRQVGIQAEVRVWERSVLQDEYRAGNRSAYLTDWGSAYFDPFDLGEPKLTIGGRGNFSFYANPRVDELLRLGSTTADEDARREAYREVQAIIHEEAPWVFGYTLANIEAASASLTDWAPAMDNRINLHDVGSTDADTIVVAMNTNAIFTLDPAMHRDRNTETVIRNMFDGLVTRTHGSDVVAELAVSWEQESETSYVFELRPGVTFHDGSPMTADDVVFTFDRVLTEGAVAGTSSPRAGLLGPLERVEKVDDMTVRFVLGDPFPPFLQALVQFQIVPQAYVERVGDEAFAREPIGTGPFRFVRGALDNEIVMDRYDDYYGGAPELEPVGPAQVERAVFRMMPEPSTRVAALLSGEVHIIQAVPVDLLARLEGDARVQVATVEGTRSYQIELNNASAPFDDVRVRRALNLAIDWEEILEGVYVGYGERLATSFLPSGFGFDPDLAPYPYDPEAARDLLRDAGYTVP